MGCCPSSWRRLLVTGTGGLALLAGFILLGQAMGTTSISTIVAQLPQMPASPTLTAALVLMLVGTFTKSAQFPFHFWLPNAMSAYLHSATMVKLGVYLLARFDPGFGEWTLWKWALKAAGSLTAAWGMVLALRERDLKRILAWSTVATLSTLVTLVGLRGEGAKVAVGALLLAHALYKAKRPCFSSRATSTTARARGSSTGWAICAMPCRGRPPLRCWPGRPWRACPCRLATSPRT